MKIDISLIFGFNELQIENEEPLPVNGSSGLNLMAQASEHPSYGDPWVEVRIDEVYEKYEFRQA